MGRRAVKNGLRRAYGSILTGFVASECQDTRSHGAIAPEALRNTQNQHMNDRVTLGEIITPEMRNELLARSADFEAAIQKVFNPYKVTFQKGVSLSKMVKESPLYQSKSKKAQTEFFNEVKSLCRLHKVGEHLTVEAVIRGYWARFNGTLVHGEKHEKAGEMKQVNISFMAPEVAASKLDGEISKAAEKIRLEQENAKLLADKSKSDEENARLQARILELEAEVIKEVE